MRVATYKLLLQVYHVIKRQLYIYRCFNDIDLKVQIEQIIRNSYEIPALILKMGD